MLAFPDFTFHHPRGICILWMWTHVRVYAEFSAINRMSPHILYFLWTFAFATKTQQDRIAREIVHLCKQRNVANKYTRTNKAPNIAYNFIHYAPQTQSRRLKSNSNSSSSANYEKQHQQPLNMCDTKKSRGKSDRLRESGRAPLCCKEQNKKISTTINKQKEPKSNATEFSFWFWVACHARIWVWASV